MTDPQITPDMPPQARPEDEKAHDEQANDEQAGVMQRKMQHDVAAWAASRAEAPSQALVTPPAKTRQPATKDPAKPATPRTAKSTAPAPAATGPRKPFSMAYDGRPAGKYAAERFDRGAR